MQVYKAFFRILYKKRGMVIMYLCIFMALALALSANVIGNTEWQEMSYCFSVFDEDDSEISRNLAAYLSKGNERKEILNDEETIQDELYNRNIDCVLRIPKGFGASLENGTADKKLELTVLPGTLYERVFHNLTEKYITILRSYLAGGFTMEEAIQKTDSACQEEIRVSVADTGSIFVHSELFYVFNYLPYIFISICMMGIGAILIVFHREEVRARNSYSSYSLFRINAELFAGTVTAGIGLCVVYFLMVLAVEGRDVFTYKGFLHCLNMFSFLIVSLGLAFFVGQVVKKTTSLNMISNFVGLGMSFLCGIFVSLEYLGDEIIRVAHFLPAYWYVCAATFIDNYVPGKPMTELWADMGIEILFGIALVSAGLAYSKSRVQGAARE